MFKKRYAKPSPMQTAFLNILTAVHFLSMAGLAVYGLHRIWMIWCWQKRPLHRIVTAGWGEGDMPRVTIQIPLYNEPRVAGRIIDAVALMDWPGEKLQVQVLDDSDDETRGTTEERA